MIVLKHSPNSFAKGVLAVLRASEGNGAVVGLTVAQKNQKKHVFSGVFSVGEAYFSRNSLVAMAWGRISREIGWSGWPGGVFLEK